MPDKSPIHTIGLFVLQSVPSRHHREMPEIERFPANKPQEIPARQIRDYAHRASSAPLLFFLLPDLTLFVRRPLKRRAHISAAISLSLSHHFQESPVTLIFVNPAKGQRQCPYHTTEDPEKIVGRQMSAFPMGRSAAETSIRAARKSRKSRLPMTNGRATSVISR